jgi:hypothetical protein
MNQPNPTAAYVTAVVTLYMDMPDTPMRISASDQWLARTSIKMVCRWKPSKPLCCSARCAADPPG